MEQSLTAGIVTAGAPEAGASAAEGAAAPARGFAPGRVAPALVERAARGDRGSQAELYRVYGSAVYTLARRMTGTAPLAEEILQETFVEVLNKLETLREPAAVGGWIRAIAVNKVLMSLRASRWLTPLEQVLPAPSAELLSHDLQQLLDRLPAVARTVVWLHDVEGYTHQEIGALLGRTASFSKSQLARAYRRLRLIAANRADPEE